MSESKPTNRTLYYLPIVHTEADLGGLAEEVRSATLEAHGRSGQSRKESALKEFWSRIERVVRSIDLPADELLIYQDGLPMCGHERRIVEDLASQGSVNHVIVKSLIEDGAAIVGTESPDLLLEEYEMAKQALASGGTQPKDERKAADLLERRDRFIGERIDQTLGGGETGILFIGMLHRVDRFLPDNVTIIDPFDWLASRGESDAA